MPRCACFESDGPVVATKPLANFHQGLFIFDELALHADLVAQRMDSTSLLLDGPGVFISVEGNRKIDYGSCTFHIWADNMNRLDQRPTMKRIRLWRNRWSPSLRATSCRARPC